MNVVMALTGPTIIAVRRRIMKARINSVLLKTLLQTLKMGIFQLA
jgi:hypothetical protein